MRKVAQIMGMPITVDIPDCRRPSVFEAVFDDFRTIDDRFSPFKKDSEVSRYARGELELGQTSANFQAIKKACEQWEKRTRGYFSAYFGGKYDPTGYVKGWAIARAGERINQQGYQTFCISAGGDILARGGKIWRIGIQNPRIPNQIIGVVKLQNGAVATSGTYERGQHIINPKTKKPAQAFLGLSVAGSDIIKADVLATAGFAAEKDAMSLLTKQPGYEFLGVMKEGHVIASSPQLFGLAA